MPVSARDLAIADFTYELPDDRIARHPAPVRDEARQLVYRDGVISEGIFRDLADRLPAGTLLIGNRTRVIHARLHFPVAEGKRPIEIFCLEPVKPADYALSLGAVSSFRGGDVGSDGDREKGGGDAGAAPSGDGVLKGSRTKVRWQCLVGGNRRWKRGALELSVTVNDQPVTLVAERGDRTENTFEIAFSWTGGMPDLPFGEVLAAAGNIPLPPYLGRTTEAADHDRYQTVFAKEEGSVAAPTAGLHFTPAVLDSLAAKNIAWAELTLHVGAGTFQPVSAPTLGGHVMHREYFEVGRGMLERLAEQLEAGRPVVCVGTTSLRCLESLRYVDPDTADLRDICVGQWVTEDTKFNSENAAQKIRRILNKMDAEGTELISGHTGILLSPAADIRVADGIITNFHQPNSTLLLLIAAFVGEEWKNIYAYALKHGFRFLSYGDSSLLWK